MRIGVQVRPDTVVQDARRVEQAGLFGVVVDSGPEVMVAAAAAATATTFVRIIVRLPLDADHPLTLAEDLAVLDNVSGGRVVALLDTASLDGPTATEAATLVRAGLAERPVRHDGPNWTVPAGTEGQADVESVQVTPATVQVEVPTWIMGGAADEVSQALGLARVATVADDAAGADAVAPGLATIDGTLDANRETVIEWADAGATHLLASVDPFDRVVDEIALHLGPEAAMPSFPRVISETMVLRPWPGPARYVDWPPSA